MAQIDPTLLGNLCDRAQTARWEVTPERFEVALVRSMEKAFPDDPPSAAQTGKYLQGLHLDDLALACACEDAHEGAWEHFVREFRPQLYRAAAAIDPRGGARDVADALYADLFGLKMRTDDRQSLFRYFHGRSSLSTWLRSVLSQRYVDRIRENARTQPLLEKAVSALADPAPAPSLDRSRHVAVLMGALATAVGRLVARDRLRLACYHAQNLTLAQIGRLTGEHEATVSRHLSRTRREVRLDVEEQLRKEHGMADTEIAECLAEAVEDSGVLDVAELLGSEQPGKNPASDRST